MLEGINAWNRESHLKKSSDRIIVCLDEAESEKLTTEQKLEQFSFNVGESQNSDLNSDYAKMREHGFTTGSIDKSFIISPISSANKLSKEYVNCTGLIVVGKDKETGKNISFLTHQNPRYFLGAAKEEFISALESKLSEMKNRCEEGTIDAIAYGGMYDDLDHDSIISEKYLESEQLIKNEVVKVLNFKPEFVNGPKIDNLFGKIGKDEMYFKNETRQAYFIRPKVNSEDFKPQNNL